jgi:hypothetical protein
LKIPKRLSEGQTTLLPQKDTKEVISRTDNTIATERYQRGYQKDRQHNCHKKIPKRLSEGQTTQLPQKDTKEVIRRTDNTIATERYKRGYKKDRQHNYHRKIPKSGNCVVCPSDNLFGIFLWQLCCLSF